MWLNNWFTTTKNTGLGDLVPETERGCNCWDGCWIQGLIQARNVLYNWAKSLIQTRLFLREAFNSTDMVALWCDFSTQQFEDSMIYLCKNTHTHTHLQKYNQLLKEILFMSYFLRNLIRRWKFLRTHKHIYNIVSVFLFLLITISCMLQLYLVVRLHLGQWI